MRQVAPHAGAWIETPHQGLHRFDNKSLPTRERGLKLLEVDKTKKTKDVAPHAGAWIETFEPSFYLKRGVSLPTRERGLKLGEP